MVKQTIRKAGNINAAHLASLFNAQGKEIGTCMDTPNNMAYAMSINKSIAYATTPFMGKYDRKKLNVTGSTKFTGEDAAYHAQYVKFI